MERDPSTARAAPGFLRGLSFAAAVALVVGNMVGTSSYALPATLARSVGPLGIAAWVATALGYGFVAVVYARLAARTARTGGPYVYVREAFGDFAAFQTVWSYWLSTVIGNAAIALFVVGYGLPLALGSGSAAADSTWARFAAAQAIVWALTAVNLRGVRASGRLQIAVVALNIVPLVAFSAAALSAFDPANLQPFAPMGWSSLPAGMAIVVWAYSGIESATVPAEEVEAGSRTISRATLAGYALATAVFLLAAVSVAGALPNDVLAGSERPVAAAFESALGVWPARIIGCSAVVAGLGTLNGWILMAGRIPVSAAADGLFFRGLARLHPRWRTPHAALFCSAVGTSALLCLLGSTRLRELYEFILLLAVLTTLLPHLYAMGAEIAFALRARARARTAVAVVAFLFVLLTIYGCGSEQIAWGTLLVLAGTPAYAWFRARADPGAGSERTGV